MKTRVIGLSCSVATFFLFSLLVAGVVQAQEKIKVFVSIVPQQFFVEQIGGDRVEADVLVLPGQSPATYSPSARQMASLSISKAFFRIGVPFENGLIPKIASTIPGLKIFDTRKNVPLRVMGEPHHHHGEEEAEEDHDQHGHEGHAKEEHHHDHHDQEHDQHDEEGEDHHHHEDGKDPHIWMSPKMVMIQADNICEGLSEIDPAGAAIYKKNAEAFKTELSKLDQDIAKSLAPVKGRKIFVFHPAFGYFCDAYGLKQEAVETGGKSPSARQLAAIIEEAKEDGVRVIFVQPEFSKTTAQNIAHNINGVVVPLNPLAKDYVSNLQNMADEVRKALLK